MWKLCYSIRLLAKVAMAETILLNIVKQLRPKQTEQIQNLQKTQADSTNYSLQK